MQNNKVRTSRGVSSAAGLYEIDCNNERLRVVSVTFNSGSMASGKSLGSYTPTPEAEWDYVTPHSISMTLRIVCAFERHPRPTTTAENLQCKHGRSLAQPLDLAGLRIDDIGDSAARLPARAARAAAGARCAPQGSQNDARLARFVGCTGARMRSITDESLIHATAHRLLQMLLAVGHPVPSSIRALARIEGRSKKKVRC
jgi:hypothetical protein